MNDITSYFPRARNRLGFHYHPDTLHYRDSDLQTFLPRLLSLNASWLVLRASPSRAIPENFLCSLLQAGIEPLLDFQLPLENPPPANDLRMLFETYARWGIQGIILFDRPNNRSSWHSADWAQLDLVERFLERYLPFATLAVNTGLNPLFPPLQPGGSYWDTAFLKSALESLERRKQVRLLDKLVITAHAWTSGHSLNWGAGGPARWKDTRPYYTPSNSEDQIGFRIFDWYNPAVEAALERKCPIILLGAGARKDPLIHDKDSFDIAEHTAINHAIAQLMAGDIVPDPINPNITLDKMPENILCANIWLLAADESDPSFQYAWYKGDVTLPVVDLVCGLQSKESESSDMDQQSQAASDNLEKTTAEPPTPENNDFQYTGKNPRENLTHNRLIRHYLLLPSYEWGIADWHLDVIRPFVKKHSVTVGFSLEEALLAEHVTVIGNAQTFPEEILERLRTAGCRVERIDGDGTSIASKLAER